ncbi:hypothetical protein AAG570_013132, partial [Ranatra chinensis]
EEEAQNQYCSCVGTICRCCVDFDISYVDLGGPGCVAIIYKPDDKKLFVNVTYGDSQLHIDQIKDTVPTTTCISLLGELAQLCAEFTDIEQAEQGPKGCVSLTPKLLGSIQETYKLGCFTVATQGMTFSHSHDHTHHHHHHSHHHHAPTPRYQSAIK